MGRKPASGAGSEPARDLGAECVAADATADQALIAREKALRLRERDIGRREQALRIHGEMVAAEAALVADTQARLREANERLVIASVKAQEMMDAAEQVAARMAHMAGHDYLTGLPNRSALTTRLTHAIAFAQRHGNRVAVMYLDLDHFKHINDSLGHAVGDQLLQLAAKRLQACVRRTDTVSRQGGDEFVVLLADVEQVRDAELTAEKLIEAMTAPYLIGAHRLHVSLSIGISLYPDDGEDVETGLRHADIAMYHAKESGRNNYRLFTAEMNVQALARQSAGEALRAALERGEFVLNYQPKVNLVTGAITGAEALLRWRRPGHELVQPCDFVRIAEANGLILPIGKWVLREACRQTAAWLEAGFDIQRMAVNVSSVEFHAKEFLSGVRGILDETGLAPGQLELEMTESGLMQDTEPTMALLCALKDLGVHIAVDDFGTGYSCLGYLRRFPIDTLKIDQSFVQDIDGEAGDAIVSAIVAMGSSLKQRVVAEGIETSHQLAVLGARRCPEGQGFLFSQPVTAEAFEQLLATRILTTR